MTKIALDLGLRKIALAQRDADGEIDIRIFASLKALKQTLKGNVAKAEVAFESCASGWALAKWLKAQGHLPIMIDTTRLAEIGIGRHGRKTDEIDVELMLKAMEQDRLPKAHIMSDDSHQLRQQIKIREQLVATRATFKTMVKQLIRSEGEAFDRSYDAERIEIVLEETTLSKATRLLLEPVIKVVVSLSEQIAVVNTKIAQLAAKQPVIQDLCSVPGVGPIVATTFTSVIDDAKRFKTAHQVQSYLGLVPREHSSGGKQQFGHITKAGNSYLRSLLVQAAWGVMHQRGSDKDPLKLWAEAVAKRRGKTIAIVALARRIAGILWALWRNGTVYEPARLTAARCRSSTQQQAPAVRNEAKKQLKRKLQKRAVWNQLMTAA